MVGNSVIECSENNSFVPPPPNCRPFVGCQSPEPLANGHIVTGFGPTYKHWETITYSCNEDYEMVGNSVIECSENNSFVPPPPICRPFVGCQSPEPLANGHIVTGFGPTYKHWETITYSCNEDYEMVGNSVIECSENNSFVPPPPICRPFVGCQSPEPLANGHIVTGFGPTYKHWETITYSCNEDYEMVGNSVIECSENNSFVPPPPICRPFVGCQSPEPLANGHIVTGFGPTYKHWETITYSCNEDYEMVGNSVIECSENNSFVPPPPICRPFVGCQSPEPLANGHIVTGFGPTYKHWETITYSCNEDYEMVGNSVIECSENNSFVPPPPICRPFVGCQSPEPLANGHIVTGFGPTYKHWETITYSCNEDYEMVGNSVIECSENNSFVPSPPICRPFVGCQSPEPLANGHIVTGFGPTYKHWETITYSCNEDYEMVGNSVIECSENNSFVPPPPICRPFVGCQSPEPLANGHIVTGFGPTYKHWETITYSCNEDYEMVGNSVIECSENNSFVPPPPICRPFVGCQSPEPLANGHIVTGFGPTYKHWETITYSCNEDYEMVGNSVIECSENNSFVPPPPICRPFVGCQSPEPLANGHIVTGFGPTYKHWETITYSCNEDYEMVGNSVIECSENNSFVPPPPICRPFVGCQSPEPLANGHIVTGFGPTYKHWETITYSCNEDYEMVGNSVIECSENNSFVPSPPICRPFVGCQSPEPLANGHIVTGFGPTYKHWETITYSCNEDYEMVGNSVIECSENNSFVPPPPICRPFVGCQSPEPLANGHIVTGFGPTYKHWETITYSCNEDYEMVGNSVIECSENNSFVPPPPICRPFVGCQSPEPLANGHIVTGFGPTYKHWETITYSCNEGYEMVGNSVIECSENNSFVPPPPICRPFVGCQSPEPLANGHIVTGFGPTYKHWETITYSCNEDYELVGNSVIECSENNSFVPPPPICRPFVGCQSPEPLANGHIVTGFGPTYKHWETITYSCNEDHEMVGNSVIECSENNSFVPPPPICRPFVGCQSPEPLANGHIVTGFGPTYKHWETITYSCNEDYEMVGNSVIECSENNSFVPPPPICRPFVGCQSPEPLVNGHIVTGFGPTYKRWETITYSCNEDYEMVGNSVIECSENNSFVPPPPTCRPCE
uniref:complement receptor type 2-like n=1 Tax=Pristiophorus japonicus TaxID=55135 RepID=UPI00398EAF8C